MTIHDEIRTKTTVHEVGHAVAAVLRGGELVFVEIEDDGMSGVTRWSQPSDKDITAFVAWAGPYYEHLWLTEHNADYSEGVDGEEVAYSVYELMEGSDRELYDTAVDNLEEAAERLGLSPVGQNWCRTWAYELSDFYPVAVSLAERLARGETLTHELVVDAITARQAELDA
ncbi:hypothetical protein MMAG44476_14215 [Mycolicibacterium mageritense DSM 44476 = CIP 104973]|uniref:Peptidase M41 domain-containing protein n=1 Tax=Mycolicibacterium mageritense TaxID=53462 RepID=A0ABM7HSR7_MYCME|nr:M50 family metallopeptidase [Mycolicibacterium mageritense]BBX33610.1 hypothetical protein MMAGJ_28920 [Mycolicibacterium mageritense]CDO22039.1 hypothetical protein BN978_02504 [Mycolicibacterium mageritense DSM 44476 = CIP 104973]